MLHRVFLAILLTIGLASPALANIGRVKRFEGVAWIERGGAKITPQAGTVLLQQDKLVTGKNGRISVTFADNTRFSAGPNSNIALNKFSFDRATHKGEFETMINRGSVAIVSGQIAKENPKKMTVRTPTSVLGVRGTRFIVTVR